MPHNACRIRNNPNIRFSNNLLYLLYQNSLEIAKNHSLWYD